MTILLLVHPVCAQEVVPGEYLVSYALQSSQLKGSFQTSTTLIRTAQKPLVGHSPEAEPFIARRNECDRLRAENSAILYCAPNFRRYLMYTPNDPLLPNQWGLSNMTPFAAGDLTDIVADEAWGTIRNAEDVVVAVIDSGAFVDHPDLLQNVWINPFEVPGNGLDDDGNGYVDDIHGYDVASFTSDVTDPIGHGTHVAGTIGARGDNGIGVSGVSPRVKLMFLKVRDSFGISSASFVRALEYVIAMKRAGVPVRVVNMSLGGSGRSVVENRTIQAARAEGIALVAAAGNFRENLADFPLYPASFKGVISVAAMNLEGKPVPYSNYGPAVDIAAPGSDVLSTVPFGFEKPTLMPRGYGYSSGTSMAAPHVAGALALLAAFRPELGESQMRELLLESATRAPDLQIFDEESGRNLPLSRKRRLLNVQALLQLAQERYPEGLATVDPTPTPDSPMDDILLVPEIPPVGTNEQPGPRVRLQRLQVRKVPARPRQVRARRTRSLVSRILTARALVLPDPHLVTRVFLELHRMGRRIAVFSLRREDGFLWKLRRRVAARRFKRGVRVSLVANDSAGRSVGITLKE